MTPQDRARVERLRQITGKRVGLKEWESIQAYHEMDGVIMLAIETFDVKVLVREDRFLRKGKRMMVFNEGPHGWYLDADMTAWDIDPTWEPYVFEKGARRRDTAEESTARREWEKMCYRPGNSTNPLDSYDRVLEGYTTDKMERHF